MHYRGLVSLTFTASGPVLPTPLEDSFKEASIGRGAQDHHA